MPWSRAKPCATPGCPNMQPCAAHKKKPRPRDKRPNSHQRGYGGADWTRTRMRVLHRDKVCAHCGATLWQDGRPMKGATVHHVAPRWDGGTDDPDNLVAVCAHPCHDILDAAYNAKRRG